MRSLRNSTTDSWDAPDSHCRSRNAHVNWSGLLGPESAFELGSWILLNWVNSESCVLASYYRAVKPQPCLMCVLQTRQWADLPWRSPRVPNLRNAKERQISHFDLSQGPMGWTSQLVLEWSSRVCNCFSINQSKVGRKALGDHGTVLGMLLICIK